MWDIFLTSLYQAIHVSPSSSWENLLKWANLTGPFLIDLTLVKPVLHLPTPFRVRVLDGRLFPHIWTSWHCGTHCNPIEKLPRRPFKNYPMEQRVLLISLTWGSKIVCQGVTVYFWHFWLNGRWKFLDGRRNGEKCQDDRLFQAVYFRN